VILQQVEESREELSAAVVSNIGELVLPGIDKLKKSRSRRISFPSYGVSSRIS